MSDTQFAEIIVMSDKKFAEIIVMSDTQFAEHLLVMNAGFCDYYARINCAAETLPQPCRSLGSEGLAALARASRAPFGRCGDEANCVSLMTMISANCVSLMTMISANCLSLMTACV